MQIVKQSDFIRRIYLNLIPLLLIFVGACGPTNYSEPKQQKSSSYELSDLDKSYLRAANYISYKDSNDRRKLFWNSPNNLYAFAYAKSLNDPQYLEQEATFAGISHGCNGMTPARIKYMEKVLSEWRELAAASADSETVNLALLINLNAQFEVYYSQGIKQGLQMKRKNDVALYEYCPKSGILMRDIIQAANTWN